MDHNQVVSTLYAMLALNLMTSFKDIVFGLFQLVAMVLEALTTTKTEFSSSIQNDRISSWLAIEQKAAWNTRQGRRRPNGEFSMTTGVWYCVSLWRSQKHGTWTAWRDMLSGRSAMPPWMFVKMTLDENARYHMGSRAVKDISRVTCTTFKLWGMSMSSALNLAAQCDDTLPHHFAWSASNEMWECIGVVEEQDIVSHTTEIDDLLTKSARTFAAATRSAQTSLSFGRTTLIVGPPGNGKSTAIRQVARQLGLNLYSMLLSDIRTERMARTALLGCTRGVLVIDDVDRVLARMEAARQRRLKKNSGGGGGGGFFETSDNDEEDKFVVPIQVLLSMFDTSMVSVRPPVVFMTANDLDVVMKAADGAFSRSGRIDAIVHFSNPIADDVHRIINHIISQRARPNEALEAHTAKLGHLISTARNLWSVADVYALLRASLLSHDDTDSAQDVLATATGIAARVATEHLPVQQVIGESLCSKL